MARTSANLPQAVDYYVWARPDSGIRGIAEHAHAAVDRCRTCGPPATLVAGEPIVCLVVIGMCRVEECNQNVDIEQSRFHCSSRKRLISAILGLAAPAS